MNGRKKIEKYRWLLSIILKLNKITPKIVLSFLWALTNSSEKNIPLLIRYCYLKKRAKSCGDNIYVGKYVTIKNLKKLNLGSNISIHAYGYIDAYGGITIGDDVSIANHTTIVSFEHTWEQKEIPIKYNETRPSEVVIQNDVWIGSGCRILSGVTIHARSIIAAGCVVNKSVPSNVIMGGIPCRVIKDI
ncbi:acyltransferase [Bacillus norwichensis]|uniref:Acyltransferase n=1 Tax=Bacillus norwichensis TaxID=2762217 RepID=A0ABR8VHL4_9BACI|nr:acyltransferase [Bacillus norwichensis]MBD8004255.1 acyltransferase [Bacillus norwichensis]